MFTLFHDPVYYGPTYWFQPPRYSRRQSLFERYLDALDRRFFLTLTDDAAQLLGLEAREKSGQPDSPAQPPEAKSQSVASSPDAEANPPSPPSDAAPQKAELKPPQPADQRKPQQINPFGRQYVSVTRSTFNGHDYVEEHREKVTGADGQTRIATRRRLGDRWYENEIHIDQEGKKTERETWHNVGDDDIETFKREWSDKHPNQSTLKTDSPVSPPAPDAIEPPSSAAADGSPQ
jgi:hypothetical protein